MDPLVQGCLVVLTGSAVAFTAGVLWHFRAVRRAWADDEAEDDADDANWWKNGPADED